MTPSDERKHAITMDYPGLPGQSAPTRASDAADPSSAGFDLVYVVDWFFALTLFVLTLPILALALIWVAAVDRGNPIFSQIRIGLHGEPFRIYKIRTMSHSSQDDARFCSHGDERILPGAAFLRKTRIDELPQFLNVIKGDMALVGPRPEQPFFVETFLREIPGYSDRFQVKPGITGLAQITQGYVDSTNGTRIKLQYDVQYIQGRSLASWFRIVLGTIRVVAFGHGAR